MFPGRRFCISTATASSRVKARECLLPKALVLPVLVRTAPTKAGDSRPWTDAQGNKINDFAVYWTYANRKDTQKIPFGVWHLRLGRYWLMGEMKLMPEAQDQGACNVDLKLNFEAGGANMVGFLGVDPEWSYGSNGRMERQYLDGISAELIVARSPQP